MISRYIATLDVLRSALRSANDAAGRAVQRLDEAASSVKAPWLVGTFVLLVHLLPRVVLGKHSIITTHDGLDSDILYRVLLAKPGRLFDYSGEIPELLNGVPRLAYPTGASLSALLFFLFDPYWAYVILEQAVHGIGFAAMYVLLRDHLPQPLPPSFRLAVAAIFAFLPYYSIYEASISGQPAVAWALLHLYKGATGKRRYIAFAILALFPCVSVLPTAGAFIVATVLVAAGVTCLLQRKWHRDVWLGIATLIVAYCIVDYPFVHSMLTHNYVSHREVWDPAVSWRRYFRDSNDVFYEGHYHASSVPTVCVWMMSATLLIGAARRHFRIVWTMAFFLLVVLALSYASTLHLTPPFERLRAQVHLLRIVNVRTYWCAGPVYLFGFAVALYYWWSTWRYRIPAVLILLFELFWVLDEPPETEHELAANYRELAAQIRGAGTEQVTYADFLATPVYEQVKEYIGLPPESYRVISVGIDPARAAFNGFYCADGYHNNYPLEYKARFRKAIAANLRRDDWAAWRYDDWGSRVYAFIPGAHKSGYRAKKRIRKKPIENFSLKTSALRELGVKYVLTAARFADERKFPGLRYVQEFTAKGVPLAVHVYAVRDKKSD